MSVSIQPQAPAAHPPARGSAVSVSEVAYRYGDRLALDGLSLDVPAGSIFGLLGPNGSGKSTLLSILIGRRIAAAGDVRVLGEALAPALRARMAVVFQEPSLDGAMTVRETMALQARMFGMRRHDARAVIDALLDRMALADRAGAPTDTLSGGMRRRLDLARALLTGPDLVLLDEPTLALDLDSRQALWTYLLEANAAGVTLLLATNDVYEAERYCHEVALIADGRLVARGTPRDLKRDLRRNAVRIEWRDDAAARVPALEAMPGVGRVRLADHTTHVTIDETSAFLSRIFQQDGAHIAGVQIEESTLEDVYFQLVGRGIAEHAADGAA